LPKTNAMATMNKARDIDEYIASFPAEIQKRLKEIRSVIQKAAPKAEEAISYAMPTFKLGGKNLVHFAGYDHHVGFYPAPVGMDTFKKELSKYKTGKGSVQFPHEEKLPTALIARITKFRASEMQTKPRVIGPKRKKK
jgi:uncharacterized protein YdhG (YjbR/CyaY superfamily)